MANHHPLLSRNRQSGQDRGRFRAAADLARSLGRRDLAVIVGQAAENAGFNNFRDLAFPITPTPPGSDWTWIHAISRQESQFSQNAMSRTGARV
jgi:soluble lytic murein transglycosylase